MGKAFLYDQLNSFGRLDAAGDFPDTIDLGEASIERMTVDIKFPKGAVTGGPVTVTVKGSDAEDGTYAAIVQSGPVTVDQLNEGYGLPVPKNGYRFVKTAVSGTFTGTVEALINSYLGA